MFDLSNVRILKEIEKTKMGMLYFAMSSVAELSNAFGLRNLCHSKISVHDCWGAQWLSGRMLGSSLTGVTALCP